MNNVRRCLFLVSMPMVYISFALPLRADELGASAFEIGGLFSIFTISLLVIRPLVGFGLDAFGRRPFFLLALLVYCLANLVYSGAAGLEQMFVARFLQGVGASLLLITTDTITADLTTKGDRAEGMGRNIESQSRGGMLGAFIGFTLVGSVPLLAWHYSFVIYAAVALLALIYALFAIPETRAIAWQGASDSMMPGSKFRLEGTVLKLMIVVFLCGFFSALIQPVYLIYLKHRFDVSMLMLAFAFLPAGIIYATLPSKLGALGDRWGRANTITLGLLMAGLLYIGLPLVGSFIWVAAIYTFGHIGWALADPARQAWVGDLSEVDKRGRNYGISELFGGLGASLGPLAGGYIYEYHGQDLVFYASGISLLAVAVSVYYFLGLREQAAGTT